MPLRVRPTLDEVFAFTLGGWELRLLCRRDDGQWEVHLFDGTKIWFGYANTIEAAIDNAVNKLQGSASLARHQPTNSRPVLDGILKKLKPKIELGRRV